MDIGAREWAAGAHDDQFLVLEIGRMRRDQVDLDRPLRQLGGFSLGGRPLPPAVGVVAGVPGCITRIRVPGQPPVPWSWWAGVAAAGRRRGREPWRAAAASNFLTAAAPPVWATCWRVASGSKPGTSRSSICSAPVGHSPRQSPKPSQNCSLTSRPCR